MNCSCRFADSQISVVCYAADLQPATLNKQEASYGVMPPGVKQPARRN